MLDAVIMATMALAVQAEAGTDSPDLALEVARLVRRLDARELDDREAAEKALIKMGPKVLEFLPAGEKRVPAEAKQRLDRIKVLLQKQQAEAAAANSTITLSGERMLLSEIFEAIQEQTGNTIKFGQGGPDPPPVRLDIDYKDAPFWPTFDKILDDTSLAVDTYNAERVLSLHVARGEMKSRVKTASYDGPFRFQAVRVDASRDLRIDTDSSMSLTLEIAWEPRFRPISLQQQMSEIELADENGEPIIIAARGAQLEIPVLAEAISTELRIPLEAPARSVQKIASVKGAIHALMQGKAEPFEFTDLEHAENVEKRAAGVTVILERVRKNRDVWEIRVITRFDNAEGALASHRNWVFDNPAKLIGPDGEEIPFHAYDSTRQMENEVGVAYFFGIDELEGYRFVYETASTVLSASFNYELKDIRLP